MSGIEGPAMETLPSEEKLEETEMEMGMEPSAETHQISGQSVSTSEGLSKKPFKSPPKNGIPPRRLSTATKRAIASTPAPTPRSNPLSSSRNVPGNGLSKPPTRPLASSSTRRPTSNLTANTAASSGHKKSSSISSTDKSSKDNSNVLTENTKPDVKRYGYGKSDSGLPSENSLQDKVKQNQNSKAVQSTSSPNKSAPRSSINPRQSGGGITPRNAQPTLSSSRRGAVGNEVPRKRLSTIPASPAPTHPDPTSSNLASHPSSPTRVMRPALGSRKSTMSITIEQRLREMELVHQMIHIAMAEDGGESDEVKEEYGRKVDESLASLRTKLAEARRNEGIADREADNQASGLSHEERIKDTDQSTADISKLRESFDESQSKVSALTAEVSTLRDELNRALFAQQDSQKLVAERDVLNEKIIKMREDANEAARQLHDDQTSKIEELIVNHEKQLKEAHSRVDDLEFRHREELASTIKDLEEAKRLAISQSSKEIADSLGLQIETHKSKFQALEQELKDEKDRGLDASSKLHHLQSDISTLQKLLSETSAERQKQHDTKQSLDEEYHRTIKARDQDILGLKTEIGDLQSLQASELEEVRSSSSAQRAALESDLVNLRQNIRDLETSHHSTAANYNDELASKECEIKGLGQVIKESQDKIKELHEMKERGIDETKHNLIQEHQRAISDFRRKNLEEFSETSVKHSQELESLREQDQNILESTKAAHAKKIEDIQTLLEESKSNLEQTKLAKEDALTTIDSLNKKISSLVSERDDAKKTKLFTETALKHTSDENESLKKSIEALSAESREKEEQYLATFQKIKGELNNKVKLHATDLQEQESKNQSSFLKLQNSYDSLLATWNQAEKEHPATMEKLKTEHTQAVQNHTKTLEDLKNAHANDINSRVNEVELKHQQEVENLKLEHEKEFSTFRKDAQDKEDAKLLDVQEVHEAKLSDIALHLHEQNELLAHTEEQLQDYKDKGNSETQPHEDEGLLQELERLKAEADRAKEEIKQLTETAEEVKKAVPDITEADQLQHEISLLMAQHSAEMSKVHENAAHEREKREKERRQGAEIRDRLASETERMRNDLLKAQADSEEHQKALDVCKKIVQEANGNHAAAQKAAEHHESEYYKAIQELKTSQAKVEEHEAAKLSYEANESSANKQELEALQIAADRERIQNAKLKEQMHDIQLASERQATKLREVECALKVTTAELIEAQTSRPNGNEFSASPAPKSGLRSSRWGALSDADQDSNDDTREGEALGPFIEGNIAGIQEQIRQLEDINNDMLEDEHRAMKLLSKVSGASPRISSKDSRNQTSNPVSRDSFDGSPKPTPPKYEDEAPRPVSRGSLDEEEL